ncbi:MAG TPA: amino-acid N-acetyltransferase [Burkholderiales bacterium]|nr:amino-acid N-acetyltransferase [Burkholderiales bacterium]
MARAVTDTFLDWFRAAAPYIHAFRGRTFVIAFGGEVVADGRFVALTHDLNLLASLGVKLVLVHGARAQIGDRLKQLDHRTRFVRAMRVTDDVALTCCMEASGRLRVEIEALLSMRLPASPMAGAEIRVASGNFVTARPVGVIDGVDMLHTGEVRKIDAQAIRGRLDAGEMVLLSPLGYAPTGEIFNLTLEDVACETAIALAAAKLVFLMDTDGVIDRRGKLARELTASQAEAMLARPRSLSPDVKLYLPRAVRACRAGVARAHLISRHVDGALLTELFTDEGIGTLVTRDNIEQMRAARGDDVGGILRLIEPLEAEGVLVRRSRELLEMEIDRFTVLEHDQRIVGCAALYPFPGAGAAEMACFTVESAYRGSGMGARLLAHMEAKARSRRIGRLFVLTTRAAHWFIEHGFAEAGVDALPAKKQALYNWQRRSKVFVKSLLTSGSLALTPD